MSIASDGTVTIVAHRSEMGCGSRTALPLIVADELDADWSKVRIEQAIGDPKYGEQDTDGSHSVRSNFELMRQVGATGRAMLITAAAAQWNVPAKECTTEPHFVVHKAQRTQTRLWRNGRRAPRNCPFPRKKMSRSRSRSEWRYIGKESNSLFDLPEIVTGKAIFGMDATMPGMVYASIEHPPVLGQKIKSYDDKAALKVARRAEDDDHRHIQAAAPVPATRRSSRDCRQHLGRIQGPQEPEDRMGQQSPFASYNSAAVSQDARSNLARSRAR